MLHQMIPLNEDRQVYLERFQLSNAEELSNITHRPAVIVLPGGGYSFLSQRESEPIAMAYLGQGYNAFILHYSVGEYAAWPNPLEDVDQAIGLIRANSDAWQVDPNKICTVGFSAGGHLSLSASCLCREKPNAQILGYPVALAETFEALSIFGYPSLLEHITGDTAPAFIFATMEDELVPIDNSIRLVSTLHKHNVPCEIHIFKRGCHGMSLATPHVSNGLKQFIHPEIQCWFDMSMHFLRDVFGEFPQENPNPHWKLVGGGLSD